MTKEDIVIALRVRGAMLDQIGRALQLGEGDFDTLMVYAADLIEAQAAEIDELKARVPRWIPVEERLPETAGSYIVCTKSGSVVKVNFYPELGRFQRTFTHWMPLPGVEV